MAQPPQTAQPQYLNPNVDWQQLANDANQQANTPDSGTANASSKYLDKTFYEGGGGLDWVNSKDYQGPGKAVVEPAGQNILAVMLGGSPNNNLLGMGGTAGVFAKTPDGQMVDPFQGWREFNTGMVTGSNLLPGGGSMGLGQLGGIMNADPMLAFARNNAISKFGALNNPNIPGINAMLGLDGGANIGLQGNLLSRAGHPGSGGPIADSFGFAGGGNPWLDAAMGAQGAAMWHQGGRRGTMFENNPALEAMQAVDQMYGMDNVSRYTDLAGRGEGENYGRSATAQTAGLTGVEDTGQLQNDATQKLLENIQSQAEGSLGIQSPEALAALEAAGVGRSGSAGFELGQVASDILGQANRDKMNVLSQANEANMAREAQAIAQRDAQLAQAIMGGAQLDSGAAQAGLQRQASLGAQGLGEMAGSQEAARNRQANAIAQMYGQQLGLDQQELDRLLQLHGQAEQFQQGGVSLASDIQARAMQEIMGQQQFVQGQQMQNLQEILGLGGAMRDVDQQQLAGMYQVLGLPMNTMMQLATGSPGGAGGPPTTSGPNPWVNLGMGALGSVGGQAMSNTFTGSGGGGNIGYQRSASGFV